MQKTKTEKELSEKLASEKRVSESIPSIEEINKKIETLEKKQASNNPVRKPRDNYYLLLDMKKKGMGPQQIKDQFSKEELKAVIAYARDKDSEIVEGRFRNYEAPGAPLSFSFQKYEGKPERYTMMDGEIYKIPLGVAKHLNNNCNYPVHAYTFDENDKPSIKIGKKVQRYGFEPLSFDKDVGTVGEKQLVTVERV